MRYELEIALSVAALLYGYAFSPRLLLDVQAGISPTAVLDILGKPGGHVSQGKHEAWLYEYENVDNHDCQGSAPNYTVSFSRICTHAIVRFDQNTVSDVTGAETKNHKDCGRGLVPINWEHMPSFVEAVEG